MNNLYQDLRDGESLCKVISQIDDKKVSILKIQENPQENAFKKGMNCCLAFESAEKFDDFKPEGIYA